MQSSINTQASIIKRERNYGIDILKFIASIAIVLIHVDSNYRPYEFVPNTQLWNVSIAVNILTRWAIPIFIMASGYFLLNDNSYTTYKDFLKKRLSKILIPFIAVSMIFTIYYQYKSGTLSIKWIGVATIKSILGYPASAHLWFLYPLIGLYILTPIFKAIIDKIDIKMIIAIIGICILVRTIVPILDITQNMWESNYWREIPLGVNPFTLYFILGGYLGRHRLSKQKKHTIYIISVITLIISCVATYKVEFLYNRTVDIVADIGSINNLLASISIFIFMTELKFEKLKEINLFKKLIKILTEINFGVFLLHPIFIDLLLEKMMTYNQSIVVTMLTYTLIIYIITSITVYLIKRIPVLKQIV